MAVDPYRDALVTGSALSRVLDGTLEILDHVIEMALIEDDERNEDVAQAAHNIRLLAPILNALWNEERDRIHARDLKEISDVH